RAPGTNPSPLAAARLVLTLHNIGFQGVFALAGLTAGSEGSDAPDDVPTLEALSETDGDGETGVNFLKTGIRYADRITTVSPRDAQVIWSPREYGMGLEALLRERTADLSGILNGVDYSLWAPETEPFIEPHYDRADPSGKRQIK